MAILLAATLFVSMPSPLFAVAKNDASDAVLGNVHKAAGNDGGDLKTQGKIFPAGDLPTLVYRIIVTFFTLLGLIFLMMMLYGGYNWLTSMGEEEKVETAKKTITAAVIGILVIIASYSITVFVIGKMFAATAP